MKKIAIFLPNLRGGGVEKMRLTLTKEWIADGHHVDLVLMQSTGELLANIPDGCRVIDLQCGRLRETFGPLVTYLRRERPDALLAAMWPLTVIAPAAARVAGTSTRVAISEHTNVSMTQDRLAFGPVQIPATLSRSFRNVALALAYRLADARVAVSTGVARDAESSARLPKGSFCVIHNPAATTSPELVESPVPGALLGLPPSPLILSVGNLKPAKDYRTLIGAFARLPAAIDARLCIVGEGPLRQELETLADELGVRSRVILPGFQDPNPFYQRATVFALSSAREGFGNVLVEAMLYGLPIVSTDCPSGPSEILQAGRYGRLVPVGDTAAFADALMQSLGESVDRERQRRRASEFTPHRISEAYLSTLFA